MAFAYKKTITIDRTKVVNTNQTDFPILVSRTDADLKTVGNGGKVTNANGYDIGFYSDSALTSALSFELEKYVATTGEVVFWVKIPTLSTSVDTVIYIAYADSGITTNQSSTATWNSGYIGVYHFPNGTTLTTLDSTANGNNTVATGTPTAQTGMIDGGIGTSSGNFVRDSTFSVTIGTTNTVSAWMKHNSFGDQNVVAEIGGGAEIFTAPTANIGKNCIYGSGFVNGTQLVTGTWYYISNTRNGTGANQYKSYLNGAIDITTTRGFADSGSVLTIGNRADETKPVNGIIDEVRISNVVRSADWILTEYNNQSSPSTFYSVGPETPNVSGGGNGNNGGLNNVSDLSMLGFNRIIF